MAKQQSVHVKYKTILDSESTHFLYCSPMSMDVLDETALEDLVALGKRKLYLPPPEERREIRRRLKLRQADIARLVGVAPITVSAWENGRSEPRGEPLMKLHHGVTAIATSRRGDRR